MLPPSVMSGCGGAGDSDERVDADLERDAEAFAAGIDELAAKIGGGGKGYGVDEDVELAVLVFERGKEGVDFAVDGDVALETGGAGKLLDEVLGFELHALVLVADGQGGSGCVEFLGDAPGDGTLVGEPEDHGRFACQIDHACVVPPLRFS